MEIPAVVVVLASYGLLGGVIWGLWRQLVAKDRQLVAAWKDGYLVPPQEDAPVPVPETVRDPYEEFSPMLKEYILSFESEEGRAKRLKIAKSCKLQGMSEHQILQKLETPAWLGS